jgi:hypothetical protein
VIPEVTYVQGPVAPGGCWVCGYDAWTWIDGETCHVCCWLEPAGETCGPCEISRAERARWNAGAKGREARARRQRR